MRKNRLGTSSIEISPFTLGAMSFPSDKQSSLKMIEEALDAGINHIDTANLYQFGENEKMIGAAIKDKRQDIVLTTKVGNRFNKHKKSWIWDPSPSYINDAIDQSLKRLQTDYIDLYLLHGGTIEDPIEDIVDTFESLKKSGKIRAYGISSIRPNVIHSYLHHANIDAIMMQYSLLDRRPEELFSHIEEKGVHILARGPLAKGLLTNKANDQIIKKAEKGYEAYSRKELLEVLTKLHALSESQLASIALAYVLQKDVVRSAVFGTSSLDQLRTNIHSFSDQKLTSELYEQLQAITKQSLYESHRF